MLYAGNKPVNLSTGVQLFNNKVRVLGCNVRTRTAKSGGFDHPILMPGLGPKVCGWEGSLYYPPHPDAEKTAGRLTDGNPVDFSDLTSPNAFWRLDSKEGRFVIMDHRSRKMLRVSPLAEEFQGGFWRGIHRSYEQVRKTGRFVPETDDPWFLKWYYHEYQKNQVYVALNPAPYHGGQAEHWSFPGPKAVLFEHDIEANQFSEEFEQVKAEELMIEKGLVRITPVPV